MDKMLKIEKVDWHLLENAKEHHTDKYEIIHVESTPVLRRAQQFRLTLTMNRPFKEDTDKIRLIFSHGNPKLTPRLQSAADNTTVSSTSELNDSRENWSLQLIGLEKNNISVLVKSPHAAAWGLWDLSIKTSLKSLPKTEIWKSPKQFYLLFNPWCPDDEVYMPETRYLDEYILNDIGKVYTSSYKKPIGMKWIFGQFAAPILKVISLLFDKLDIEEETLGSPTDVCYYLASNIKSILEGNWNGDFSGGTPPWLWTGSVPIYETYLKTQSAAKFGQCFVYSAVLNTGLRAVGIPARSVTCFVCPYGGDKMSISFVFNKQGISVNSDSIWNFHAWNDAWMARLDLPIGYGGWQATDGTNEIGPASLEAVKKGELCHYYNVKDFVSGTNADRVRWSLDDDGEYHLISVDTKHIGRCILTKQPFIYDPHGDCDFEDIVDSYKEREGTKEERLALYNALKQCKQLEDEYNENVPYHVNIPSDEEAGVHFSFEEMESVPFGQPILAVVNIENKEETAATVDICCDVSSMYYNGAIVGLIKRKTESVNVKPNSSEQFTLEISPEEYAAKLVEFTTFKLHVMAAVKETNFVWANDADIVVDMPGIHINSKQDLRLNKEGIVVFSFENELKTKLTKCSLTYESPGIGSNVKVDCKDFKPGEEVVIEVKVKPSKGGETLIKAIFRSKELNFFEGSSYLEVM